jgi:hypothetical protein
MRILIAAIAALLVTAAPAAAAPPGNWSFLRSDGYRHYACKFKTPNSDSWKVDTYSKAGKSAQKHGIGVYAAVARGSNGNLVRERTADPVADTMRLTFKRLRASDRLWIQAAAYGPARPWSKGDSIIGLRTCDR